MKNYRLLINIIWSGIHKMCGICGIIYFDGKKATKDQLKMMTDTMVHRGPDDEGYYRIICETAGKGSY